MARVPQKNGIKFIGESVPVPMAVSLPQVRVYEPDHEPWEATRHSMSIRRCQEAAKLAQEAYRPRGKWLDVMVAFIRAEFNPSEELILRVYQEAGIDPTPE